MEQQLRVAVIGCGAITQKRHLPEYQANKQVEIVAICDPNVKLAKRLAAEYRIPHVFDDYRDMFETCQVDAVSVCTPNRTHSDIAIACMRRGMHVLCEKPMATRLEDACEMVRTAREQNVMLMIGHNQRFVPAHVKAKEILSGESLGRVLHFRLLFAHGGPEHWSVEGGTSWFFKGEQATFGSMGDLGIHKIDLIQWLCEEEIVEVGAMKGTLSKTHSDVDDNAVFLLRLRNGALGTLGTSWTQRPWMSNETVLLCEKGTLRLTQDPMSPGLVVEYETGEEEQFAVGWEYETAEGVKHSGVIQHFVEGILSGRGHSVDGVEGLKAMQVLFAAEQSIRCNSIVRVQEQSDLQATAAGEK